MAQLCSNRDDATRALTSQALAKEVLSPQSPYAGLGVIIVSALAMLMAMGSSVLVISARMGSSCASEFARTQATLPIAQSWHTDSSRAPSAQTPCGTPIYRSHHDGSISVHYRACDNGDTAAIAPASPNHVAAPAATTIAPVSPNTNGPITVQLRRTP